MSVALSVSRFSVHFMVCLKNSMIFSQNSLSSYLFTFILGHTVTFQVF